MRVALICTDKPNSLHIRTENRPAHVEYLKSSGVVDLAGPFLDADGAMCGSLVVVEVETMQQAQDWAAGDPYAKAGLFASVELRAWNRVIG